MPLPNNTFTIANGASVSTVNAKGSKPFTKLFVENHNAGATLFAEISRDGITYRNLSVYQPEIAAPTVPVIVAFATGAANFAISIEPWLFSNINFLRFTSNQSISAPGGCTITLY